jgi:hypothetical protein
MTWQFFMKLFNINCHGTMNSGSCNVLCIQTDGVSKVNRRRIGNAPTGAQISNKLNNQAYTCY